ncbi:MAG: hypothetical protein H7Y88_05350, partial [Phycisphaerales bacterium]|nr:hypothetical protein [Phycisphaerales bacterium]
MSLSRLAVVVCFVFVLALPFMVRGRGAGSDRAGEIPKDARTLVVITPHVEQIRSEFEIAFDRWHTREYGGRVRVDWRVPGGTSEIMKLLEANYQAAAKNGAIKLLGATGGAPAASAGGAPAVAAA